MKYILLYIILGLIALLFILPRAVLWYLKRAGHLAQLEKAYEENPPHLRENRRIGTVYAVWESKENKNLEIWFVEEDQVSEFQLKFNYRYYSRRRAGSSTHRIVPILFETHLDHRIHKFLASNRASEEQMRLKRKSQERGASFTEADLWVVLDRVDGKLSTYSVAASSPEHPLPFETSGTDVLFAKAQSFARFSKHDGKCNGPIQPTNLTPG